MSGTKVKALRAANARARCPEATPVGARWLYRTTAKAIAEYDAVRALGRPTPGLADYLKIIAAALRGSVWQFLNSLKLNA